MGLDPVRTAADTSSAQRPTMRPASRPRPTTRPARPSPDRTGRQCACSLRQPQPLPASGPIRRDTCTRARCRDVRKPGPVRCPRGRVRRPHGRHDRTGFRTPPARSYSAGHCPLHPARHGETGSDADRERTNGTEGVRTSSIAMTTAATRQLLGVALASKPRLGALLSSDDFGSSVEREAHGQVLWRVRVKVAGGRWELRTAVGLVKGRRAAV
jgi:hypothetical protein